MIINLYKINSNNTFGGVEESHSDVDVDISQYQPPRGYTFIAPVDKSYIWNNGAWVAPEPPYVPALEEVKENKCIQIRAESDGRIALLEQGYTTGEVKTFEQQYSGALAIVASNLEHEHALFVQDLFTVRLGRTPTAEELVVFAQKIIGNYDMAKAYTINIIGTQQYLENLVKACATIEEVEAITW